MTGFEVLGMLNSIGWKSSLLDMRFALEVTYGLCVDEINREYALVADDKNDWIIYFGGTENTIFIQKMVKA